MYVSMDILCRSLKGKVHNTKFILNILIKKQTDFAIDYHYKYNT